MIGLLYAVPAAIAGYHATLGLAHIGVPSEAWREAFAIVGAVLVGATAWARMSLFVPPHVERRRCGRSGIASTGGSDQGRVSPRFIVDRLTIGALSARPR